MELRMDRLAKVLMIAVGAFVVACGPWGPVEPIDWPPDYYKPVGPSQAYRITLSGCFSCDTLTAPAEILALRDTIVGDLTLLGPTQDTAAARFSGFSWPFLPDTTVRMDFVSFPQDGYGVLLSSQMPVVIFSVFGSGTGFSCAIQIRSNTDPRWNVPDATCSGVPL